MNWGLGKYGYRDQGVSPAFNRSLRGEGNAGVQESFLDLKCIGSCSNWLLATSYCCYLVLQRSFALERFSAAVNRHNLTEVKGAGLYQLTTWPLVCSKNETVALSNSKLFFCKSGIDAGYWHVLPAFFQCCQKSSSNLESCMQHVIIPATDRGCTPVWQCPDLLHPPACNYYLC